MKWTNEELNTFGIIKRINEKAENKTDELIFHNEGYIMPEYVSQWNNKQSKDFRFYFDTVKRNIIDNYDLILNNEIRQDYNNYLLRKEQLKNKIILRDLVTV